MKQKLLIFGAGAIGRGYLPWVFSPDEYDYYFVEPNATLRDALNCNGQYTTYQTGSNEYIKKVVKPKWCYDFGEEFDIINNVDAIITAAGPRNAPKIAEHLKDTDTLVICFENDITIPDMIKSISGNSNVVFGIPDVIASNTAPSSLKALDELSIVTEKGNCYIDDRVSSLGGNCYYVSQVELDTEWTAKLYLHNTPHCIIAYLGSLAGKIYIHECLDVPFIKDILKGCMTEMIHVVTEKFHLDEQFALQYAQKEIRRFENKLLFDPITRVAREPFRKLNLNDRLLGAAQLCLCCGVIPKHISYGIMAAFLYDDSHDPDAHIKYLVDALPPKDFLKIMGLQPTDALYDILLDKWDFRMDQMVNMHG